MIRRIAAACLVLVGLVHSAAANGRPPGTTSITFRQGHETDIVAGLTFGLIASHDGGKTWGWYCEEAFGVNAIGSYDPRHAYLPGSALFSTTLTGLDVTRDSCTFMPVPSSPGFVSALAVSPTDHALYYAAVQAADAGKGIVADYAIYKSTDEGMTFPTKSTPPATVTWWQSLRVAPSDPTRLYLTGYNFAGTAKQLVMFRSDNAGTTWTPLSVAMFTVQPNSDIDIMAITPDNPDQVFARVTLDDPISQGDAIYRSNDKGVTWTKFHAMAAPINAFVVRAGKNAGNKHDVIVGTQLVGVDITHDDGANWAPIAGAPHMNCLVENAAGELWACSQNYGSTGLLSDGAGIMKSTDATTWTKVLRYQDLSEVASCAAGTVQHDRCGGMWCAVCAQLGCSPSTSYGCPALVDAPPPPGMKAGGCCDAGSAGAGGALGLGLGVLALVGRRRCAPNRSPRAMLGG